MRPLRSEQARALHLAAQGLLAKPPGRATKAAVLAAVRRMELLQIDTIHVVARSPYLTLFSRLGAYRPEWLDELLAEGSIFECWAHEACFAPMDDFLLHRRRIESSRHWSMRHARRMESAHREGMQALLEEVGRRGPVKTADFESVEKRAGGWWGWKQEKRWLEAHFALGRLMIARRDRFHRVYELTERVLARARPEWVGASPWPADQVGRELILRSVRALGVSQAGWIADYFREPRRLDDAELEPLVARGELLRVEVEGWARPGYLHPDHAQLLAEAQEGALTPRRHVLLSPFDPVVWDRKRALAVFGFDYKIECYTPAEKRRYGYFSLPILEGGALVGRLDAKAHREQRRFEVKALFLEEGVAPGERRAGRVARAIVECARWHRCPEVQVRRVVPRAFAAPLKEALGR